MTKDGVKLPLTVIIDGDGCDNIHSCISTTGDLAFSHQQELTVLNSQEGFWRSLSEISLFCLF